MDEESLLNIDLNRLEEEAATQPNLRRKYGEMQADAKLKHSERKANLDVVKAQVGKLVRAAPESYGVVKVTEKSVEDAITTHHEVEKAVRLLNKAKHKLDLLEALVNAIDHRKSMISDCVALYLGGYFAEPKIPKDSDFKERQSKTARKKVKIHE